jgi:hypothetical protein
MSDTFGARVNPGSLEARPNSWPPPVAMKVRKGVARKRSCDPAAVGGGPGMRVGQLELIRWLVVAVVPGVASEPPARGARAAVEGATVRLPQ